jgi:large subunit ribosomal protein L29
MANKKEKDNFAEMTVDELNSRLHQTKEDLFKLRIQHMSAPLKNPRQISEKRRDIAKLNTFLTQKGALS